MNAPDLKNPRSGFHVVVLIGPFCQVAPSLLDHASNVPMSWFAGSCLRSSHIAVNLPCWSDAIHGKNWFPLAGLPAAFVLMGIAFDHVAPPSCERLTSMSPFPFPRM